ncbi:MAG TPA: malto-oligosyltrehalose trehalohydrolase [Acidimicrobiales bacterium]|nr:malto-oligosyltrehalose trehalohydrolase [Acidimicrobiales bacterium]
MSTFGVWAPAAAAVELELGGERRAMEPAGGGWYRVEAPVEASSDYRFVLDGDPLPDPRSPSQPAGPHGPSRTVDHEDFKWSDVAWKGIHLPSAVVYELHVGTFTPEGTFDGVISRLDHLVDLGIDAVELLPVAEFPGDRGWGYDGVDLFAPHHSYGGPDGLKRLVDACHERGLAVVMDVVYNHLGPAGNYLTRFGPYFTDRYATPWGSAVNLDGPGSDEVRRFFVDNAVMWLRDYHMDGLRLDAVHGFMDTSAVHFLEQLGQRVEQLAAALGRSLFLVAESDLNDPRVVKRREVGGYGMDAQWSDDFHHALHAVLTGERDGYYRDFGTMAHLATALEQAYVYAGDHSAYRERAHGRPIGDLPAHRFLGYLQNHDQVGNRAVGERSSALVSPGRLKVGAALVMTAPFIPMLFQGEEWGASTPFQYFTDHDDPALGQAVSEGRRREFATFGWDPEEVPDPQDPGTFARSRLDWSELDHESHQEILSWYRRLIALRRDEPALRSGFAGLEVTYDEERRWMVVRRDSLLVAGNVGPDTVRLPLAGEVVLASDRGVAADGEAIALPPDSVAIVRAPGPQDGFTAAVVGKPRA